MPFFLCFTFVDQWNINQKMLNKLIVLISLITLLVGCNKNLTEDEKKEMWSKAQTEGEIIRRSGTPLTSQPIVSLLWLTPKTG